MAAASSRSLSVHYASLLSRGHAGAPPQTLYDPKLSVTHGRRQWAEQPTAMAFVAPGDFLVLEKVGRVRRVLNGVLQPTPARRHQRLGRDRLARHRRQHGNAAQVFLYYTEAPPRTAP